MEFIQKVWQENKRFLLQTGAGLSLFLILNSCVINAVVGRPGKLRADNQKAESEINALRGRVIHRLPEERKTLEDMEEIEKNLRGRYLTAPPSNVPDAKRGAPQIQFSERIERIWGEVKEKANQKNVKIPEKISTNELGVGSNDGPEDHERNAAYLDILGRALHACVDQGMTEIGKPAIIPEEDSQIRENASSFCFYRRLALPVQGPYAAYKAVLREFQKPGGFVQVRLMSLDAKGAAGTAALRGQLEFVGVYFWTKDEGEAKPAAAEEKKPAPSRKRRKR